MHRGGATPAERRRLINAAQDATTVDDLPDAARQLLDDLESRQTIHTHPGGYRRRDP